MQQMAPATSSSKQWHDVTKRGDEDGAEQHPQQEEQEAPLPAATTIVYQSNHTTCTKETKHTKVIQLESVRKEWCSITA
jgi:hypothetical protein